MVLFKNVAIDV